MNAWQGWGLAMWLVIACWTDIRSRTIPNRWTVSAASSGLLAAVSLMGWQGLWEACFGIGCGFALMLPLYWCQAVGAGDVKLFAAIGAWAGAGWTALLLLHAVLAAGLIGVVWLLAADRGAGKLRLLCWQWLMVFTMHERSRLSLLSKPRAEDLKQMPFMLAVAPGAAWLLIRDFT